MRKKYHYSLLFIFIACALCFSVGNAAFTSNSVKEYSSDIDNVSEEDAVCYNISTKTYYTSVEAGLNAATSGQTVNVIPGTNPTITKDCEVKSGVTLNIPHNSNVLTYSSTLELSSSDNSVTFTVYKNSIKYLVWTGTYEYKKDKKCTVECSSIAVYGSAATATIDVQRPILSLTKQQVYDENGSNVLYTSTIKSNPSVTPSLTEGKCSRISHLLGHEHNCDETGSNMTFKYSYTITVSVSSVTYGGTEYFLGYSPVFDWSKNGSSTSVISNSNLGTFATDDTLSISDFDDTKKYSNKAIYVTTACKGSSYNNVTVSSGVTLLNNGTIYVGGSLAGGTSSIGGYSGQTYGPYSTLILDKNAKIESYGSIYCFGYIKEKSTDNGSSLTTYSGATTYAPFVVRDFRGGGATVSCVQKDKSYKCFPFNEYEVRNITCQATYKYGSSLKGWGNLYAGSQQNSTEMEILGTSSSSFINLSSDSYLYAKFNESTDLTVLEIYGGCSINSMDLEVQKIKVSSASFNFPVSFRFQVYLLKKRIQASATYTISSQSFQFLPGSSLTVGEGCTLQASDLIFYKEWPSEISTKYSGYSKYGSTRAYLVNNGHVKASTLTGLVKSEVAGASLTLTGNSSTTYQIKSSSSPSTWKHVQIILGSSSCIDSWSAITNTTTFYSYTNNVFSTSSYNSSVAAGTYTSIKDSNGVYGFKA